MRLRIRRVYLIVWAALLAVALGLLLAWYAGARSTSVPESRARETAEGIRRRVHELTH